MVYFFSFRIQAGKNHEALELLKTAMKIEEKELGARNHRMVELYALMAEIYDEVRGTKILLNLLILQSSEMFLLGYISQYLTCLSQKFIYVVQH